MKKYNHFKNRPIEDQDSEGTAAIWAVIISFMILVVFMAAVMLLFYFVAKGQGYSEELSSFFGS